MKLDRDWITLPDGSKIPRPRHTVHLSEPSIEASAVNDTESASMPTPASKLVRELTQYFEHNYLDGDKIQQGQMIASTEIARFIQEAANIGESYALESRVNELTQVVRNCPPKKEYDRYVTKRVAELSALQEEK